MNHLTAAEVTAVHPWNQNGGIDAPGLENWVRGRLALQSQLIDSLKVEQHHDRATLTANIPIELLQQLAGSTAQLSPGIQPSEVPNAVTPVPPNAKFE